MKVTMHPAGGYKPMLPLDTKFKDCRGDNRTIFCFKAGELRLTVQLQIFRFLYIIVVIIVIYYPSDTQVTENSSHYSSNKSLQKPRLNFITVSITHYQTAYFKDFRYEPKRYFDASETDCYM